MVPLACELRFLTLPYNSGTLVAEYQVALTPHLTRASRSRILATDGGASKTGSYSLGLV